MSDVEHPAPSHALDPVVDQRDNPPRSDSVPSTRGVGAARHLVSVVVAVLAVPAGYLALDYAGTDAVMRAQMFDTERLPARTVAVLLVAIGLFMAAALAGRLSGLGPLVAGVLWGVLPTLWVLVDFDSFARRVFDVSEWMEPYDRFTFGVVQYAYFVFPTVAGLLLGLAVAGRWRRPAELARW